MARRKALQGLTTQSTSSLSAASSPLDLIPVAQRQKRGDRSWEKGNRSIAYFIPDPLVVRAKDIRSAILGLAQKHTTSTASVAGALMKYSLAQVRAGILKLNLQPASSGNRRRMELDWKEASGWAQEIPEPKPKTKRKEPYLYLNYRWGGEVDKQIKGLASKELVPGEVIVFLLGHALDAYRKGRLTFEENAAVVNQNVTARW